jgi:hypothetical protein
LNNIYRLFSNQQSSEKKFDELPITESGRKNLEPKIVERKVKHKRNSDQYLRNKINIALSDSVNSQNIECKVETGSIHEITISSKTGEHQKL